MIDPEIDRNRAVLIELSVVVSGAMLLASAVLFMDEPPPAWNLDKNPTQPVEIRYFPIPEPTPIRPSLLMDWPLSERMVDIENEVTIAKEEPAPVEEPKAEKESVEHVERSAPRRERRRYHRRWRRHW